MVNPFTRRYAHSPLLIKTHGQNLFWVLLLMVVAGLAVLVISATGPGIGGAVVVPALFVFVAIALAATLLLTLGQLEIATWLAYGSFLLLTAAISLLSRSGLYEMDLFQAAVVFFLGLLVLPAIGVGGWRSALWVVAGAACMVWIIVVPADDVRLTLTIAEWNREYNPLVISAIYLVGAVAGTILLIQGQRNLRMMQWDQEIIESSNTMLAQTVEQRTLAMRTILDSSGQGLFTFGEGFGIEPDYSAGCQTIFEEDIYNKSADTLLFPQGSDASGEFRQGLSLYFSGKAAASVIFDLLEKETFVKGKALKIEYRELSQGSILVVLTDVTLDRRLADLNRADEARRTLVLKALGHKRYFAGLMADAEKLFGLLRTYEDRAPAEDETGALLEYIHTFKGNCGFFGFSQTQEVAHDFEYAVTDSIALGEPMDFRDLALDLKRSYYLELNIIVDALGRPWLDEAGGIAVPRDVFDKVARYIGRKFPQESRLVDVLEHFRKLPLRDLFSRLPFVAQATAEKLGKRIRPVDIRGGEIRVVPDRLDGLVSACVHIINNMVDHGIEPPYVREAEGKSLEGALTLTISREEHSVILEFSDDGQGISLPEVEARARENGLIGADQTLSPRETLQLLFEPGFSTRSEATEISGRGIGLGAVRREAERLGGQVEIQSKLHAGTTLEIILPLGVFANRRGRQPIAGTDRRRV